MVKVRCRYCGSTWNIQDDHVIAKIKGGTITVPCCRACNLSKSVSSLSAWLDRIKKTDPYKWGRIKKAQKNKSSHFAKLVHRRK